MDVTIYIAFGLVLLVAIFIGVSNKKKDPHASQGPANVVQKPKATVANEQVASAKPSPNRLSQPQIEAAGKDAPEELTNLKLTQLSELPPSQVSALVARMQTIPRPPHALDKLVSAEFLAIATSAVLNDLMVGEPQIAAKVLASVNSPMYGLQKPLGSIGQAATYLGMNTVRGICMQHMLDASFKTTSPELNVFYETIWKASAYSSELCFKLAQLLHLPEPGNLVTQVILSYLGPLTSYSLLDKTAVISLSQSGPIERARIEQEQLGLCAREIGSLLMQTWKVPSALIEDVHDIALVMVTPCKVPFDARGARLALCYLCNCIGMMLAKGELVDLRTFDIATSGSAEHYFLLGYLKHPSLVRLTEFLRFPEVVSSVDQMAVAVQLKGQSKFSR
jgi:HD-like signal output (HDOD) protein